MPRPPTYDRPTGELMVEPQLAVPPPSPQDLTFLFKLETQRGGGGTRGIWRECFYLLVNKMAAQLGIKRGGKMPTQLGIIILDNIGIRLIQDTLRVRHILVTLGIWHFLGLVLLGSEFGKFRYGLRHINK